MRYRRLQTLGFAALLATLTAIHCLPTEAQADRRRRPWTTFNQCLPIPVTTCLGLKGRQEWDLLRPPIVISHRGAGNVVAPDNTWPGFVWAAGQGCIIECDLQYTSDGHLVCHHDPTIDRMTGRTDGTTTADWTLAELQAMDFSQGHIPALFSPQPITTFEEYLDLARIGFLLAPEVRGTTGAMGTEVAQRIVAEGLQDRFLVQSFSATELLAVKAVDPSIRTLALGDAITVETAVANGYWAVSPERTVFLARPDRSEYLAAMQAAGVRVIPYVANYRRHAEELVGIGVDGWFTDFPAITARYWHRIPSGTTTTLAVPPIYDLSTWRWASAWPSAYPVVEDGFATFRDYEGFIATTNFKLTHSGVRTADYPTTQRIETTLKIKDWIEGETSRYIALYFAWSTEYDGTSFSGSAAFGSTGYYFLHRINGGVGIVRVTNGDYTAIQTATWAPVTKGQPIPLRVDLTDTTITVTRTDTEQSISVEDATHPRGGYVRLLGSGLIPAIGDVTITY